MIRSCLLLTLIPAALQTQTNARALSSMSVDAELAVARQRGLPEEPIRRRVSEAIAKGASATQQAITAHKVRVTLEAAKEALVGGGRTRASDEEVERCGGMMERGYSRAHVEVMARSVPDRSIAVSCDVVAKLNESGVPAARALAQVREMLEKGMSDATIDALTHANPEVAASARLSRRP
jgi:hypothetical protein